MRTDKLRPTISNAIKALESGKFQDFCKASLSLIDTKYQDLERFGGTTEGKTRKGTPDFIRTLDTGRQIAVQCSVDKDYWHFQKDTDKLSNSKPCHDIDAGKKGTAPIS